MTRVLENALALLLALAVPSAVALFFLADPLLLLLYGDREFLLATPVLRIMAWALVPGAVTTVLGQVFLAGVRERVTLRIVVVDAVVGLVTGAILITQYGLIGAAVAAVLTKAVDFLQHYIPVSRLVPTIRLHELSWKPVVAVSCMAAYLAWAAASRGAAHSRICRRTLRWSPCCAHHLECRRTSSTADQGSAGVGRVRWTCKFPLRGPRDESRAPLV